LIKFPELHKDIRLTFRKIRLLTFSTLYPSSARPGHGIFVETRLRELVKSGHVDVRVVAPVPWFFSTDSRYGDYARMAKTPKRETHNGIDVLHPRYFLPPKVGMTIAPMTLAMGAFPALQQLVAEGYDFDVIDAHYYYPDGVAAALLAAYFKKPFTVTARGSDINLIANFQIPRKWMQWASGRAAASIGVSAALTGAMQQLGMPATSLRTMPNGVDLNLFRIHPQVGARTELGWPQGPTLLSVGNLIENKGHHIAIESLAQLPEFRLVISGEGPQRQALAQLANELGVASRLTFLGRVDQARLAICYSAADILVLPSSREGWPNVLLESMACGTPVVATRVGGIPEIVTSVQAGRLISARTASGLVEGIQALWRSMPGQAEVRLVANARSWQSTTEAQLALFDQITALNRVTAHA
jgi:teichuronic acid biosynthesis glycosyltransferase TuaC